MAGSSERAAVLLNRAIALLDADPNTAALAPMVRHVVECIEGRRRIMVDLDRNSIVIDGRSTVLRPEHVEIMAVLLPAGVHRYESIIAGVWGQQDEPDDARNVIHVDLVHLRRALAGSGFAITTHWGRGLELVYHGREAVPHRDH